MNTLKFAFIPLTSLALLLGCSPEVPGHAGSFSELLRESPSISGKPAYLASPYVTPGDRAYMVGHQDGSFPEIGWHIPGEMGGIWAHPIKLMDGFQTSIEVGGNPLPPADSTRFVNYPMANSHHWSWDGQPLRMSRWQFVPDHLPGVALEYEFENTGEEALTVEFSFLGQTDLRPTWLGERTGMADGRDSAYYDSGINAWTARDGQSPWYVAFGPNRAPDGILPANRDSIQRGEGIAAGYRFSLKIRPGETERIRMAVGGSTSTEAAARQVQQSILEEASSLLKSKRDRYAELAGRSKLTVPDTALQQAFEWLKYNSDWMIQEVPGIGTGVTAGIPDYPWWFGVDSEYALRGYMAVGQQEVVFQTIRLIDSVSRAVNGNGRIIHEMSTNGAVFNPGNINETPQFASLIWHIYRWSGDRDFLRRYFQTIRDGLDWLMRENDGDGNGFPDGFGMMEIHGLDSEMIDVASYTQAGFDHASRIAAELGEEDLSRQYAALASELKARINSEFWSERYGSFADFRGTDQQALRLIEDAIVRADTLDKPWAVAELETTRNALLRNPQPGVRPFVLHHNWVVNTPMEMGIADSAKAYTALETARKFTNPFGVFVTGIDRDESAGSDSGSFKGSSAFSYTGAVMTLPTGVQAVAENNYGRPDQALDYLRRMTRSFSYALPGSMYEVSPDYGMIAQAWNIYAFAVPIVEQFFGISPRASDRLIRIDPLMPEDWDVASLENVSIGGNTLSVYYGEDERQTITLRVVQKGDWDLEIPLDVQQARRARTEGGQLLPNPDGTAVVRGSDRELTITYPRN